LPQAGGFVLATHCFLSFEKYPSDFSISPKARPDKKRRLMQELVKGAKMHAERK
jgi:hypothetical protein